MPDIRPFRGVRYDLARVGALSDVVAPPYDVIGHDLQDRLYQASPYNIIRLELNKEEPGDTPESNRYTRAARYLKDWTRDGILADDPHPSLYVYHQTFDVEGTTYTRKGFFARVRLEPFGQGKIYPHEQTLSGPKADRLALFKATELQPQPHLRPLSRRRRARSSAPSRRASATGRRWRRPTTSASSTGSGPCSTRRRTRAVQGLMALEADLHRRRPPPLRDRPEVPRRPGRLGRALRPRRPGQLRHDDARRHERPRPDHPADAPARLRLPRPDRRRAGRPARARVRGRRSSARATAGGPRRLGGRSRSAASRTCSASAPSPTASGSPPGSAPTPRMDALAPDHGPEWRSLGVSILHELVLKALLGPIGAADLRLRPPDRRGARRRRPTASATSPASSRRRGWSTSSRSRRTWRRCRPRARISIRSS